MHIERRIERLERQNRRLRLGLHAVLLAAVAAFVTGASGDDTPDVLRAQRVEIVDASGKPMVVLGQQNGFGFAALLDSLGNYRIQLNALLPGGTVTVKNARGHELLMLGHDADGNGNIRTSSANGSLLAEVGASDNRGTMITYDSAGHEHVKLGTTYGGAGAVTTFNAQGSRLIALTASTKGDGIIAAFDPNGRVRSSWP
jgi:hypothetical protein